MMLKRLFHYKYLSQEQLKQLENHKYTSLDTSPLSRYVMHPFWNFVVGFVPASLAPNVLTLLGFACTLINASLLAYYDYYFLASSETTSAARHYQPVPPIVWLICAINLFLSHTLDGIDGKQARRIKATGPLGELMDHGVDSWTAVFVPMHMYSFFGSADFSVGPHRIFFVFWAVFFAFYLTHWEKYNTGVLNLPWTYDASQVFLFAVSLATYRNSYRMWKSIDPVLGWHYSQVFELILHGGVLLTLPLPVYSVYTSCKSGNSKYTSLLDVIRPLAPLAHLFLVSLAWTHYSTSDVLAQDPRLYFFTIGTIFSNLACRLIVSQMSRTKCELLNGLALMFTLVALGSMLPFKSSSSSFSIELQALRFIALASTLGHIHYVVCVVRQICTHFKINCLSLEKRTFFPKKRG